MLEDTQRLFHLTFRIEPYLERIAWIEKVMGVKPFKENQIKLFLNLTLKAGILFYQHKTTLGNSNGVSVYGDTIYQTDKIPSDNNYQIYLTVGDTEDEIMVSIDKVIKLYQYKVYAYVMTFTSQHGNKVNINNYNFDKRLLDEDKLPMYLNSPILGVYAREKLSHLI